MENEARDKNTAIPKEKQGSKIILTSKNTKCYNPLTSCEVVSVIVRAVQHQKIFNVTFLTGTAMLCLCIWGFFSSSCGLFLNLSKDALEVMKPPMQGFNKTLSCISRVPTAPSPKRKTKSTTKIGYISSTFFKKT